MNLDYLLIGLAVLAFLVLALREVTVWYFKINEIVKLLRAIHVELVIQREGPPAPSARPALGPGGHIWVSTDAGQSPPA